MNKLFFTIFWLFFTGSVYGAQQWVPWEQEQIVVQQQWSIFIAILQNEIVSAIILCIAVFIITFIAAWVVKNRLTIFLESFADKLSWREEVQAMIVKSVNMIIWLFWFSTASGILWLDLAIFMWWVWMWIWFGMQALLSNFLSWLIIIFQWKFKVWDLIDIWWKLWKIKVMDTLFTEIEQFDGIKFYVPNAEFLKATVINITANDKRRCDIVIGVDYDTDIVKAKQVIFKVLSSFPNILSAPESKIWVTNFEDSSINLQVMFWLSITDDFFWTKSNVIETINLAFKQAWITIPFPQVTISNRIDRA